MRRLFFPSALAVATCIAANLASAQQSETQHLLGLAYGAVRAKLPASGERAVVLADPRLNSSNRAFDIAQDVENRAFASAAGWQSAPLSELWTCTGFARCSFNGDSVTASVSFLMPLVRGDSATVTVATRYVNGNRGRARVAGFPMEGVYLVRLVRRDSVWSVLRVDISIES